MSAELELLNQGYESLLSKYIAHLKSENSDLPDYIFDRMKRMIDYSAVGGKYFRGIQVILNAKNACKVSGKKFEDIKDKAVALAWAVEVLQACFLVADDMMDQSITRRGQPCWYRLEDVQNDAVNDSFILESYMHWLIEFGSEKDTFFQLYKLYTNVMIKTQLGQCLDLLSMPQGRKSVEILRKFDVKLHANIVKYKTAFYTFYLPMAAGLIVGGVPDVKVLKACEDVCMEIGEKFQIQDDYLDCYQDPKILGKIGTDIQDHKCSWLCVKALELMNEEQRARFEANYGHHDEENIAAIKAIYSELDLTSIYNKQEEDSLKRTYDLIEANKENVKLEWFEPIIKLVHNRQK